MRSLKITTLALTVLSLGTLAASASSHGNALVMSGPLGGQTFIMYSNHMSLYTYDKDEPGKSNCYGECAVKWPPAILDVGAAEMPESYSLIPRKDGSKQIAYKGKPLYLWNGDKSIGDTGGDGKGGVWRLAKPIQ